MTRAKDLPEGSDGSDEGSCGARGTEGRVPVSAFGKGSGRSGVPGSALHDPAQQVHLQ